MRALAIVLGLMAFGGTAGAELIPGGGAPRSDCFLELDVAGAHRMSARAAECTDGDPACDFDGACDGRCRFHVAACLNQPDPLLPNCTPPFPPLGLLRASERGRGQVGLLLPSFSSSACGAFIGVDTLVSKPHRRPGARIRTIAVSPTRPRRDVDLTKLFCRPRTDACPITTTSTSTTTTTATAPTSTTMVPVTAVDAVADTTIFSGNPDAALGSTDQAFVGNDGSNAQRALLRFDLTSIPSTATVASCTLTVDVVTLNQPTAGAIYRVKQPAWTETATWNRYDGVSLWTTPGAFNASEAASDVVVTPGPDGPVAYAPPIGTEAFAFPDLTGLCQDAVTNRGGALDLMIKQDADAPGATAEFGFSRRTDSDPHERPMLGVTLAP